jgi:FkbM family methyltransferase
MSDATGQDRWAATAAGLCRHPAVADAMVVATAAGATAYVVPDPDEASLLHRACRLEAAGRLDGLQWHEPSDDLLVAQVNRTETDFLYRETFANAEYLKHGIALDDGAVVVDVGANIGMVTLFAAARARDARIVAVEPVVELARAITINAELHEVDATVLACALGSDAGEAELTYYPGNTAMSGVHADDDEDREVLRNYLLTGEGAEAISQLDAMVADRMVAERRTCRVLTLSDVVACEQLDRIDLLKIDVEKAESDVLAGIGPAVWDIIDQIVIEVHDLDGRLGEILELLTQRGFVVALDRDQRLALTPCHTVYGHRGRSEHGPSSRHDPPPPPRWPTRRALVTELQAHLGGLEPALPAPGTFAFVAALDQPVADDPAVPEAAGGLGTQVLAEVWAELFGQSAVRGDADFFDLGGDSLSAVRLVAQVEARLGEGVLAPDSVFTASRFADLAAAVDAGLAKRQGA